MQEIQRLLTQCPADFGDLIKGGLLTGCRLGELRQATAGNYKRTNLGHGYLRIPKEQAKSGKERNVYLTQAATAFFDRRVAGLGRDALIFTWANGRPWLEHYPPKPLKAACAKADIEPIGYHGLRHTRASAMEMQGLSRGVMMLQLGHSIGGVTEIYLHRPDEWICAELEKTMGEYDAAIVGKSDATIQPLRARRA
jgi:integrase